MGIQRINRSIYDRKYFVKDLPIDYIPEVSFSFFKLDNSSGQWGIVLGDEFADTDKVFDLEDSVAPVDGQIPPYNGNLGEFWKLKKQGKTFNLTMSIGGWTGSAHFSDAVYTPESRDAFAESIVDQFKRYNIFSGISIDWEYFSNDGENYGADGNIAEEGDADRLILLIKLLREKFDQAGMPGMLISVCAPASPAKSKFDVSAMAEAVDEIHIMTYDFASSSWGTPNTTHHTNLRKTTTTELSVEEAVEFYLQEGAPPSKLLIGAASYSRGFYKSEGLGKPSTGEIVPDKSWEDGVCDYKSLPRPGADEMWDEDAQATYSWDSEKGIFNSYESARSIHAKTDYVKSKGLKGIILWESSGDFPVSNNRSLIAALHSGLVSR